MTLSYHQFTNFTFCVCMSVTEGHRKFFAPNYNFPILLVYFQSLRRGHLPIKDKNCSSQGVLYIDVPLYI